MSNPVKGPHQGQPMAVAGLPLEQASAAMIMVHGRGATAASILSLASEFQQPGYAYIAPQAAGQTWYPQSFLAPIATNEPGLTSGLTALAAVLERVAAAGIPAERTILLGFSQGACLTLEFAVRNARRYGAVIGLSGGLIGPDGLPRDYGGTLAGTPVFLGCSDRDPHVPEQRVHLTAHIFAGLGAAVTKRIYPSMGHTINQDEMNAVAALLAALS